MWAGGATTPATVAIAGTVAAPNATITFNQPSGWRRFFANFFVNPAYALAAGTTSVGSGVTVNLIQIDSNGNQVGNVIATTTTNSSGYPKNRS